MATKGMPVALSAARERQIARLRTRRMRPREGLVLVEGIRSVEEALHAGVEARYAVLDPSLRRSGSGRALAEGISAAGISIVEVDEETLARVSDTETPQGVLLVCREPVAGLETTLAGPASRFLVLDAVQDPGNAGTLIRAARAFGLDGVLALDGTVDPWNPKAVRAAAGASFRLPVVRTTWEEARDALARRGARLLVADADGEDVARIEAPEAWALAVGNEGAGSREELRAAAFLRVGVPMAGGAESLNAGVAGAILLYVLSRGWEE